MSILYSGGLVFDGQGEIHENHGVLVDEGRIERFASLGEFDGYRGETVDTTGATLLPGLIDCHVHLVMAGEGDPGAMVAKLTPGQITMRALKHAQQSLAGGVTALRDCGGRDYLEFAVRDACNRGQQLGPTIRASGRIICMTGGHGNHMGRVADGIDDVVKAVREQIHAGCDFVKIMATGGVMTPGVDPEDAHYSAPEMAAGIGEAKRFHRPTASHAQGAEGVLNAVRGGVTSIEHGIFINERCIAEMLENGTYLVPTLAAIDNIIARADAVADYVIEKATRVSEIHKRSIKAFHDAGGLIAMGTDAGTPFNHHGQNGQELALMVAIGIPPKDAIKAATATAADLMQLPAQGRIAQGKQADFLIVDGDPTQDIAKIAEPVHHRAVIKNGLLVDRSLARVN